MVVNIPYSTLIPPNLTLYPGPCPCAHRWATGSGGRPFPLVGFAGGPGEPGGGGGGVGVALFTGVVDGAPAPGGGGVGVALFSGVVDGAPAPGVVAGAPVPGGGGVNAAVPAAGGGARTLVSAGGPTGAPTSDIVGVVVVNIPESKLIPPNLTLLLGPCPCALKWATGSGGRPFPLVGFDGDGGGGGPGTLVPVAVGTSIGPWWSAICASPCSGAPPGTPGAPGVPPAGQGGGVDAAVLAADGGARTLVSATIRVVSKVGGVGASSCTSWSIVVVIGAPPVGLGGGVGAALPGAGGGARLCVVVGPSGGGPSPTGMVGIVLVNNPAIWVFPTNLTWL